MHSKRFQLAQPPPKSFNFVHVSRYWSLGIVQWTIIECMMIHLWATNKASYLRDAEVGPLPSSVRQIN